MRTLPNIIANSQNPYWFVAVLAAYYLCAWLLVGRRRDGRSIAVCYQPPDRLSPAAIRYIYTMGCDGRSHAAIVAQLSARKLLAIVAERPNGRIYVQRLNDDDTALRGLPPEEKRVFNDLLEFDHRAPLEPPELRQVERIQKSMDGYLPGKYFARNLPWVIFALLATAASTTWFALSLGMFGKDTFDAWVGSLFMGFTVAMYSLAGYWIWDMNRLAIWLALRGLYRRRTLPLLIAILFLYPTLYYALMSQTEQPSFARVTLLMILVNGFAAPALRSYTREGWRVRNEIEGFRKFLQGVEQDRLQRMNQPGREARFDDEFIPYAIALDLREGWGDELGVKMMVETQL
jgi:hypothetical protein